MKKLFVFYLFFFLPIVPAITVIFNADLRNSLPAYAVLYYLIGYILIYRPIIVGLRLVNGKKISPDQFIFNFIPGWDRKYFNFVFFNVA